MDYYNLKFQSTLPRRERRRIRTAHSNQIYFNPRSREGSDKTPTPINRGKGKFQSTLPRRERRLDARTPVRNRRISIHAPAKGATLERRTKQLYLTVFQSTLPRRERPFVMSSLPCILKFQSTLPRRERLRNSTQFATKTYRKYQIEILFFSCFSNLIHYFGARPLYIS